MAQAKEEFVKAMTSERQAMKDEFIDAAVAKFQGVFLKSMFMEATKKLQQCLEEVEKSSVTKQQHCQDTREKPKDPPPRRGKHSNKNRKNEDIDQIISKASNSLLTIYKNAVENQINKRASSSSLEGEVNVSECK